MTPAQERLIAIALNRIKDTVAGMRADGLPEAAILEAIRRWVEGTR